VDALPDGPLIVIANEFVDALPIDQFARTALGWHERKVGTRNGQLAFALDPTPLPGLEEKLPNHMQPSPPGAVFERRDLTPIRTVARRIAAHGGSALIVDYGHEHSAFGDTLQAVRAHRAADPLEDPGAADLTAHVDFEQVAVAAMQSGAHTIGPVTQGDFLRALGIDLRAERLTRGQTPEVKAAIDAAVIRLTGPTPGMGELFKALAITHASLLAPPGFDS
jgi:NADH dehydrogenase [ubiquinone] 1 alpha subcomplex assembly factor 7